MRVIRAWTGAVAPRTRPAIAIPDRASRCALPAGVVIVLLLENKSSGRRARCRAEPAGTIRRSAAVAASCGDPDRACPLQERAEHPDVLHFRGWPGAAETSPLV